MWESVLNNAGLEIRDITIALDRFTKSFESRLPIYQSNWRLQLLLTSSVVNVQYHGQQVSYCKCVDILLQMDDHDLHLADQNALDLRHVGLTYVWIDTARISFYVDGDAYASAALHCMRFLANPPKYSDRNIYPELGPIFVEWRATCAMTLELCCKLLQQATTSPELVQFLSDHDIHLSVQKPFFAHRVWEVDLHILAFLSRANVYVSWRIISAIKRSHVKNDQPASKFHDNDGTGLPRLDRCCSKAYHSGTIIDL